MGDYRGSPASLVVGEEVDDLVEHLQLVLHILLLLDLVNQEPGDRNEATMKRGVPFMLRKSCTATTSVTKRSVGRSITSTMTGLSNRHMSRRKD